MIPTLPVSPDVSTDWSGFDDWRNAPPDYDTFARQYAGYTRELCLRFSVPPVFVEDIAAEIITRFLERDLLAVFDPHYIARSGRPSRFRSFYSKIVYNYCRGKKRQSVRLAQHEPLILDRPVAEDDPTTLGDLLAASDAGPPGEEPPDAELACGEIADRLRDVLGPRPRATLEALVRLSLTLPRTPSTDDLAEELGCTRDSAAHRLFWLRKQAGAVLAGEVDRVTA